VAAEAPERLAYSRVYRLHVGLAVAGLVTITGTVVAALTAVSVAPAGGRELEVAGNRVGYPAINVSAVVLLALALLGAAVIVICLREVWREAAGQRALLGSLSVVGPLPGHFGVLVISDESVRAFCAGYVRPRVYVSTGALAVLAPRELDAVLAHEQRHRSTRDPLRLACGRILSRGLFFLPALRHLHERHGALS
jgi:Zn-dependent protease with chaperone function